MAKLPGFAGQMGDLPMFCLSGSIAAGGTPQLLTPRVTQRSYVLFQNTSDTPMRLGIGPARAAATITSGVLASIAVVNAGFGYTKAPIVQIQGGGPWNPAVLGALAAGLGAGEPTTLARATAVLSSDTIGSFVVGAPGSGYTDARPPYVRLQNDEQDPYGCFAPSATAGILVNPGGSFSMENSIVCTEAMSVFCATTGKTFEFWVMQ